jgi:Fur family zinc uptake transcriptional regulator
LGFLLEQGLIHRVESLNAFIACDAADAPHAAQFLICDGCRSTTEIHDSALEHWLRRATREFGFKLSGGIIEVRGVCSACQVAAAP